MLTILLYFSNLLFYAQGACFHCLSPDSHLKPTLRRQLKTQTDVFFWQIGTQWNACSEKVNPMIPSIEGQICSKYQMCVTLQPNIPNSTFVVRGCLESVLRYSWREDERLHKEGCYMIRSLPMYPNEQPMDYIICVCAGDYCNRDEAVNYVSGPYNYDRDTILQLSPNNDVYYEGNGRIQLAVSSASLVDKAFIFIYSTLLFVFLK
ncbi:unnamed protein product [Auanema sp. JU1783]|nr:unnamed protein product [Auanema sp. JU1783]